MNNKQSLYTKYRPQTFDQVVGQSIIKEILINSISKNKINHAYLFFGIRGTGKTTLARIFAKAINCNDRDENNNPCNKCDTCISITNGSALDVIEIDAASNNGVDEIRQIKENTSYLTTSAEYKVYIIDEVHMLTKAAFNALLKTLEEPPRNTIFILATTELQKIPQTVLSRTVILNLEVMSDDDIKQGLRVVLDGEGTKYDEEALDYIVMTASGSLRDGISALETTLLYNDELSVQNVILALGLIDKDQISNFLATDRKRLVEIIDETDKDASKLAILIMEVVVEQLKNGNFENSNFLNKLVKVSNTINDPLLLKIALKSTILSENVSPTSIRVENSNVSRETNLNEEHVEKEDKVEKEIEISNVDEESGKLSNEVTGEFTYTDGEKTLEFILDDEEVSHNEEVQFEDKTIVENSEVLEENVIEETNINNSNDNIDKNVVPNLAEQQTPQIKVNKDEFNIITDFVDVNTYMYVIKNNDSIEFERSIARWRHINNYIGSLDYKEVVPNIANTQLLAATKKTLIIGFHSENQINEFKRISMQPILFEFISNLLGDYKFILPVNEETWAKLLAAKDQYQPNDKFTDVTLKIDDIIETTAEIKKKQLNDLFGEENVKYE